MNHKWIIDVLADLRSYAKQNDLSRVAAYLDNAAGIAETEILALDLGALRSSQGDCAGSRVGDLSTQD